MNVPGYPDRFSSFHEATAPRTASDELVAKMAEALALSGEHVAQVDLQPTQRLVDFTWAAHQAGRRIGVRIDVTTTLINGQGEAELRIRVIQPPS